MTASISRTLAGALALVALLTAPAHAQTRAERREAGEAFRDGERAFEENDNEAALALFRRAFELAPNDVVRFNIAVCLERLGRHREAALEYDAAAASDALSRRDRARAEEAAERARSRLGTLTVSGEAFTGADVTIDGEVMCQVPCDVRLDAGAHRVSIDGGEAGTLEERVEVEREGAATLRFEPPEPELDAADASEPAEQVAETSTRWRGPGWLTVTGAIVAGLGAAGIITFGVLAQGRHDAYLEMPTETRRERGILYRDLANVSIGVAALGGVLVLIDLIFLAPEQVPDEEPAVTLRHGDLRVSF